MDTAPLVFPFILILAILLFILALRYMRHVERMEMIRKGLVPYPDLVAPLSGRPIESLVRIYAGAILTAVGIALSLVLGVVNGIGPHLVAGLIPFFVGLALIVVHLIMGDR